MTNRKQALTDLLAKVEAGSVDDSRMYTAALGIHLDNRHVHAAAAFSGLIDSAKVLHEAVLPETAYDLSDWPMGASSAILTGTHEGDDGGRWSGKDDFKSEGRSQTPARAWLIAILKALIALEAGE